MAALKFKSQVGPSYGNNANNRAEESVGDGPRFLDCLSGGSLWPAAPAIPWMGCSRRGRAGCSLADPRHFSSLSSVPRVPRRLDLKRSELLCERLVKEKLYTATAAVASPLTAVETVEYADLSELSSLRNFVTSFAAHIAAEASRQV